MQRNPESVALMLLAGLIREGGATVSARMNTDVPRRGFAVSAPVASLVLKPEDFHAWRIVAWLESNRELLATEGTYAGVWEDRATGLIYLDVSAVYATEREALDAASAYGQIAVYDLSASREVRVPVPVAAGGE